MPSEKTPARGRRGGARKGAENEMSSHGLVLISRLAIELDVFSQPRNKVGKVWEEIAVKACAEGIKTSKETVRKKIAELLKWHKVCTL